MTNENKHMDDANNTTADWLEELVAQIEQHGAENVRLYLEGTVEAEDTLVLDITDVKFEDDTVKVTLQ